MTQSAPWRQLFAGDGVVVGDYRCACGHRAAGPEEAAQTHSFAIVRSGLFLRHTSARDEPVVGDAASVVFFNAGEPYRVSHPIGGGDRCTTFAVDGAAAAASARAAGCAGATPERPFPRNAAPLGGVAHLLHRRLLTRLERGATEDLEAESITLALLDAALACAPTARPPGKRRREGSTRADRERVEAVCVCLSERLSERLTLAEVARAAHTAPHHLCRVFRRVTGAPIHRYLVRLRVRAAAEMLADGEPDITRAALACGFCDHSHLVRAFRAEFGAAPSAVRTTPTTPELRRLRTILQAAG